MFFDHSKQYDQKNCRIEYAVSARRLLNHGNWRPSLETFVQRFDGKFTRRIGSKIGAIFPAASQTMMWRVGQVGVFQCSQ